MYSNDLSRFDSCTIKKAKLGDLMRLKEFRARVDAYHGQITDEWVCATARKVERQLYVSEESAKRIEEQYGKEALKKRLRKRHFCHKAVCYLERMYPQYGKEV